MKRRPKLYVIQGGKRDDPPPFLIFNPFLFWFWWLK